MINQYIDNLDNGGLVFGKKIYNCIKNNHFGAFNVIGDRDIGKSTYVLKSLYECFLRMGYREGYDDLADGVDSENPTAWNMALSCCKFKIPDVVEYLKEGIQLYKLYGKKKPALMWDDLRKYASGLVYHTNRQLYKSISELLDVIKIPINVFIGTCPGMSGVMNIIQDYDSYQINIHYSPKGGDYRLAKGYLWKTSPKNQKTIFSKFEDTFYYRLPNPVWRTYEKERIEVTEESVEDVDKSSRII
jgi:hypothetical protein